MRAKAEASKDSGLKKVKCSSCGEPFRVVGGQRQFFHQRWIKFREDAILVRLNEVVDFPSLQGASQAAAAALST
jgi:hypothetical protein